MAYYNIPTKSEPFAYLQKMQRWDATCPYSAYILVVKTADNHTNKY